MRYDFDYRKERTRGGETVYRPAIYFYLQGVDKNWYLFDAYLDSGADLSLLTRSDCEFLGHQLKEGREKYIGGIAGGLMRVFLHRIPFRIGKVIIEAEIGFAEIEEVLRLLGRRAIFPHFRICFDEDKLEFSLLYKKGREIRS